MRGDSRLDFFAKSLALTGLGLIGTIGALVDYWPGPLSFPRVAPINVRRATASVQTLVDLRGLDPQLPQEAAPVAVAAVRAERPAAEYAPAEVATHFFPDEWVNNLRIPEITEAHDTSRLPVDHVALNEILPMVDLPVDLDAPPVALANWSPMTPAAGAADRSDAGFFSGMLKKTGSSVSTSLGKASNSLVGAVRAVGDAVKRAF
jgi:hypothetical protein